MNVGSEIQGFQVLATLGYGARSTVFAVKDRYNQLYALKRVVKNSPADQRFLDQAIQEHQVASKLDHPVLRKSLKLFRQRALLRTSEVYVLMELVDGATLEQQRPEDMIDLCQICLQVTEGLAAMHRAGYVHADIKPNNILLNGHGQCKIIDFGQSCPIGTVKERIQGTPDYIAPEQVLRRQITPQTDVYNFGATMYWLLTGQYAPTILPRRDGLVNLRSRAPLRSPRELNPQVPPALSQLVVQCLELDPLRRPKSIEEVSDRLMMAIAQLQRARDQGRDTKVHVDARNVQPIPPSDQESEREEVVEGVSSDLSDLEELSE